MSCKQSIQSSIDPNKSDLVRAIGQLSGRPTSSAEGRRGLEPDQRSKAVGAATARQTAPDGRWVCVGGHPGGSLGSGVGVDGKDPQAGSGDRYEKGQAVSSHTLLIETPSVWWPCRHREANLSSVRFRAAVCRVGGARPAQAAALGQGGCVWCGVCFNRSLRFFSSLKAFSTLAAVDDAAPVLVPLSHVRRLPRGPPCVFRVWTDV